MNKEAKALEVSNLISTFTKQYLTKEEENICLFILKKLMRKQKIDLITRAKFNILAASIIWAFSKANFKYDKGITKDLIADFFNVDKHTFGLKSAEISKLLKIHFFNHEYRTKEFQTKRRFILLKDLFKNDE